MHGGIDRLESPAVGAGPGVATGVAILFGSIPRRVARYPLLMDDVSPADSPRRLVWSEVRDLLLVAGCESVDELIAALEQYRADPPIPNSLSDDPDA